MQPTLRQTTQSTLATPSEAYRSLGLSIAILLTFLTLGFLPALPALFLFVLRLQGRIFVPLHPEFWLPAVAGLCVMIASVVAWIGRPPLIRVGLRLLAALSILAAIYMTFNPDLYNVVGDGMLQGGSLDQIAIFFLRLFLPFQLITLVYTAWYTNRAPAIAFFERK